MTHLPQILDDLPDSLQWNCRLPPTVFFFSKNGHYFSRMETTTLRTVTDELIDQVKDRIVEACDPEAVFLFGSAARGEIREGSDIDLLVIVTPTAGISRHEPASQLYKLFWGWLLPLDIVVRTPEEYAREKNFLV